MKIDELIEMLETCNPEDEVLLSQNSCTSSISDAIQLGSELVVITDKSQHADFNVAPTGVPDAAKERELEELCATLSGVTILLFVLLFIAILAIVYLII